MKVLEGIIQGSDEWLAIRAKHNTASEAPAVMGASKYMSRSELLKQKATGIVPEVDSHKQALFNKGHAAEEGARAILERMIGEDLYPVTCVCEKTNLLASLDGLNMSEAVAFECKLWNERLAEQVRAGDLEPHYYWQLEQELLVTGSEKVIFVTSDGTRDKFAHMEYFPVAGRAEQLIAAWKQFAIDLAAYVPTESAPVAVAKMPSILPVVFDMRVEGKLVACNLEQYKPAALAYIKAINIALVTDQDFADADADAKYCRDSADKLELAIEQALGQMGDINAAMATVREIAAAFDAKGLALEKLVKSEKDNRKIAIISAGRIALQRHESGLQERTAHHLPPTLQNFETVTRGLKKLESIQNAVDTELARCKILANATADKIQANLQTIAAAGHDYLFPDAGKLVLKAPDDLANTITARIADHQAKEAARIEADRARIRAEEIQRADREAMAKLQATYATAKPSAPVPIVKLTQTIAAPVRATLQSPTLSLGKIAERLGFPLGAKFLEDLGFQPVRQGAASLFYEDDFPKICAALIAHIESVFETV